VVEALVALGTEMRNIHEIYTDFHGWRLSEFCWNGYHHKQHPDGLACGGWLEDGTDGLCQCPCHDVRPARGAKSKGDQMHIADTGCGVIDIE